MLADAISFLSDAVPMKLEDNIHHPLQLAHLDIFAIQLSFQLYHLYILADLVWRTK